EEPVHATARKLHGRRKAASAGVNLNQDVSHLIQSLTMMDIQSNERGFEEWIERKRATVKNISQSPTLPNPAAPQTLARREESKRIPLPGLTREKLSKLSTDQINDLVRRKKGNDESFKAWFEVKCRRAHQQKIKELELHRKDVEASVREEEKKRERRERALAEWTAKKLEQEEREEAKRKLEEEHRIAVEAIRKERNRAAFKEWKHYVGHRSSHHIDIYPHPRPWVDPNIEDENEIRLKEGVLRLIEEYTSLPRKDIQKRGRRWSAK
ncbi:hypothetical protein BJ742DRAFT_905172, partial [Cladochytrium replicatum]